MLSSEKIAGGRWAQPLTGGLELYLGTISHARLVGKSFSEARVLSVRGVTRAA